MDDQQLFNTLRLLKIEQVGTIFRTKLLQRFQDVNAIFEASEKELMSVEGLGAKRAKFIRGTLDENWIRNEMSFIKNEGIQVLNWNDDAYPFALKNIDDPPAILFLKGIIPTNDRNIAMIGTRNITDYGRSMTEHIIQDLQSYKPNIISGLAYGVDAAAHKLSLQYHLPTCAVLAHGLDVIYPPTHLNLAKEIIHHNGCLITEYPTKTIPEKGNFPLRNRIVAGMSQATIVVETDIKGGSMITAKLAASFNREVFAVPGRVNDRYSRGCNYLIEVQIARILNSGKDVVEMLNWDLDTSKKVIQPKLFQREFSTQEQVIMQLLNEKATMHIDEISLKSKISDSELSMLLLSLEFEQIIKAMPGKIFALK